MALLGCTTPLSSYALHCQKCSKSLLSGISIRNKLLIAIQTQRMSSSTQSSLQKSVAASTKAPQSIVLTTRTPLFDTFRLVEELRKAGVSEKQATALMAALIIATQEAQETFNQTLATKNDFSALKTQLNEKIFNASLKYDLQQKHIRELFKGEIDSLHNDMMSQSKTIDSDFSAFRSDIRMSLKNDVYNMQQQLSAIDKKIEADKAEFRSEQERLENRLIRLALGFVASFAIIVLGVLRAING